MRPNFLALKGRVENGIFVEFEKSDVASQSWQPTLIGASLRVRPIREADYQPLFLAASDPLIWEQHPDRLRYTKERFDVYFQGAIECKGGLVVEALDTGQIIGSSRFYDVTKQSVEIGYTFLTRPFWGGIYNRELKTLMIQYAFQFVEVIVFVVGKDNWRSRRAMAKIGGKLYSEPPHQILAQESSGLVVSGDLSNSVVFTIDRH